MVDFIYAGRRVITEIRDMSELEKLKIGDKLGIDVSLDLHPSFTLKDILDYQMGQLVKASARGYSLQIRQPSDFMDEQKLMSTRDGRKIDPMLEARLERTFDYMKIEGRVTEYETEKVGAGHIEKVLLKTIRGDQTVKRCSVKLEVDKISQKGLYKLMTFEDPGMDSETGSKIFASHFGVRDTMGLRFSSKKLESQLVKVYDQGYLVGYNLEVKPEEFEFISGPVDIFRTEEISEEGLKYLKIVGYVYDQGDLVE
ncbi:MAG: hypothetical protein QF460_01800 [Candidatus Nanoarchaeia archaeon]|jgi:hypothetical protein|nr:hypothetical protein [Candidatus Nanoarchaeia archaeon]|tara:strand:- start:58 stop:822 length:765 start_codon:yes stop_codon:yes gene_type:complete